MSAFLILLSALLMLTFVALWGLLAMARWSDRQLGLVWQEYQETKAVGDTTRFEPHP